MSEIKKWRMNARLSRVEMSRRLDIPLRTIENWELGTTKTIPWAEKLVVEKLMQITEATLEERGRKAANTLKLDKDGNRPVGSWATISSNGYDEFVHCRGNMAEAIKFAEPGDKVAYVLCHQTEHGPEAWYEDKDGNIYGDYETIEWEKTDEKD